MAENKLKRLPDELIDLIKKIQSEAEKKGYRITETEAMRIISKGYKTKN
jgi:hypothetical protein